MNEIVWPELFDIDSAVELLIGLIFLSSVFPRKRSKRATAICIAVNVVLYIIFKICIDYGIKLMELEAPVQFYTYLISLAIFLFGFAVWGAKGDKRQLAMMVLFFINNCVMTTSVARYIRVQPEERYTLQSSVLSYVLLVGVMTAYKFVTRPVKIKMSNVYWGIVILNPIVIMTIWQISYGRLMNLEFTLLPILFLVLDFAVYFLFMQLAEEQWNQMELELSNQSMAFQIRQMDNVETLLENTRRQRHELKNNYFLIESLLEQGKLDEIRIQLHEVIRPQLEMDQKISTGNSFVDMLLTHKVLEAKQKNIPIVLDVLLSEHIGINQQMLCSLLCNLLDNAIEASDKVEEPDIFFYMREFKGYISIEVRNKIDTSVLKSNPNLKTSKQDRENHGIGMKMIRQIVSCSDGNMTILEQSSNFIVAVILPTNGDIA